MDFPVPADHRVKLKVGEKKDKWRDRASELKNLLNMNETVIPVVISAHGTVTKGLVQGLHNLEISGRVETIQTTVLLRSARIMKIWGAFHW